MSHMHLPYFAHILAKAVVEIFPGTLILGGEVDEAFFTYEFQFLQPLHPDMIFLLEERMRALVKAGTEFRIQEMVPDNAARLLKDKGQPLLAEECEERDGLVEVAVSGNYYDLALPELGEGSGAFKLLKIEQNDGIVRIEGTAKRDVDELKDFIKLLKRYEKVEWRKSGPAKGFLQLTPEGKALILPKGARVIEGWKKGVIGEPVRSMGMAIEEAHALIYKEIGGEAALLEWQDEADISHIFTNNAVEGCKSSLQNILKTIKILEFEYHGILRTKPQWKQKANWLKEALTAETIVFNEHPSFSEDKGPVFQVKFKDSVGREFDGPEVSIDCVTVQKLNLTSHASFRGKVMISRTLFPDIDHLFLKWIERCS